MNKKITEKYIGSADNNIGQEQSTISVDSFRATKAQSLVMLNLDKLIQSGRQNITEQDVLNIHNQELESNNLTISNIEGAYELLKHLNLITVDQEQSVQFTESGNEALELVKQQDQDQDQEDVQSEPEPTDNVIPDELDDFEQDMNQPDSSELETESFDLLLFLRDSSKFSKR